MPDAGPEVSVIRQLCVPLTASQHLRGKDPQVGRGLASPIPALRPSQAELPTPLSVLCSLMLPLPGFLP